MIKAKIVEQDGSFFLDLSELVQSGGLKVGDEIDQSKVGFVTNR